MNSVDNLYEIYQKQELNKKQRNRYANLPQEKKDLLNAKKREKVNCNICGIEINKNSMARHIKRNHNEIN